MFSSCRLTVVLSSLLMFEGLSSWMAKHCCSMSKLHSHWPGRFPRAHWDCNTHLQWKHKRPTCYIMYHLHHIGSWMSGSPSMTLLNSQRKITDTEESKKTKNKDGERGAETHPSKKEVEARWWGRAVRRHRCDGEVDYFHQAQVQSHQTKHTFFSFWKDDLAKTPEKLPRHFHVSTRFFMLSRSLWTTPWCIEKSHKVNITIMRLIGLWMSDPCPARLT